MGDKSPDLPSDYFVVTKRHGRPNEFWTWEILRRSKPLGVKVYGGDFKTTQAAKLAGENALRELLEKISQEEKA
jgi:hypothetical protein